MIRHLLIVACIFMGSCIHAQHWYRWAVVGAGPAGVISVGQLLEHGVNQDDIIWIDPEFCCGRIGKYYGNVPSNQKAGQFVEFLEESTIFSSLHSPAIERMRAHDPQKEYQLQMAADVVIDITQHLCTCVTWKQDMVQALWQDNNIWKLQLQDDVVCADKVILAMGSHPKRFVYQGVEEIPLDIALDEEKLQQLVTHDDVIMVIGSAHSAFLVVKFLYDFGVKKIINIYNEEPRIGGVGGLMGITAYWVQNVLLNNPSDIIMRVWYDPQTIDQYVSMCNKIVYAFGFEPNEIPVNGSIHLSYDLKTGIIEKNLYGIGIAFPQPHRVTDGIQVDLVGFNSFMYRAKTCMPFWIEGSCNQTTSAREANKERKHTTCFENAITEWSDRWI